MSEAGEQEKNLQTRYYYCPTIAEYTIDKDRYQCPIKIFHFANWTFNTTTISGTRFSSSGLELIWQEQQSEKQRKKKTLPPERKRV